MKFVSLLAAIVLAGCASSTYIDDKLKPVSGDLRGMIYDLDRLPVPQVEVQVPGTGLSTKTDVHGHFVLPKVTFGKVELVLTKAEYEDYRWTVDFGEISQVVYVQMADGPQLFDAAAEAIEQRQWDRARTLLERGKVLKPESAVPVLLSALLASRQGRAGEGVALLEAYLAEHPRSPVLELAAADLYERELKQPALALKHLEAAQALRYDPEVDLRIRKLRE